MHCSQDAFMAAENACTAASCSDSCGEGRSHQSALGYDSGAHSPSKLTFAGPKAATVAPPGNRVVSLDVLEEDPVLEKQLFFLLGARARSSGPPADSPSLFARPLQKKQSLSDYLEEGHEDSTFPNLKQFLLCLLYSPASEPLPKEHLSDLELKFLRLLLKHRLTLPRKKETKLLKIDSSAFDFSTYYAICGDLRADLRPAENPILKRTLANQIQKLKRKRAADAPATLDWGFVQDRLLADSRKVFLKRFDKLTRTLKHAVENPTTQTVFSNFHLPLIRVQILRAPELLGDQILSVSVN